MRLFLGFLLGFLIRCIGLGTLPPWTDECATLVFSLGNSFLGVPLNQLISPEQLMEPLQASPEATLGDVLHHLMGESTHPPFYFLLNHILLTHLWPQGVSQEQLLWASRAFSAFWGALTIPAMYGLTKRAIGSTQAAQWAAGLMALSPLGIFLAQEARHYTLAILLAIASFWCFTLALEALFQPQSRASQSITGWVCLWILVNGVGIAVHYFFGLVPLMQGLVLAKYWLQGRPYRTAKPWRGVGFAALGTAATGLVWLPVWREFVESDLTDWVTDGQLGLLEPLGRTILWLVSMVFMAPLDVLVLPFWGIVLSILLFLVALVSLGRLMKYYHPQPGHPAKIWTEVLMVGLLVLLGITYTTGNDLTLAPRFFFSLLPLVILRVACYLSSVSKVEFKTIFSLGIIALVGSLTVVVNLSYLQNHRGDRLAAVIRQTSDVPVVLAITHKHHGQTGRLQAIAWEFEKYNFSQPQQFLLAHPDKTHYPTDILRQEIAQLSPPFDVWYINFHAPKVGEPETIPDPSSLTGTPVDRDQFPQVNGYRYDLIRYR